MRLGTKQILDWAAIQGQPSGLRDPGLWCNTEVGPYEVISWDGNSWEWRVTIKGRWEYGTPMKTSREKAVDAAEEDYIKRVTVLTVLPPGSTLQHFPPHLRVREEALPWGDKEKRDFGNLVSILTEVGGH